MTLPRMALNPWVGALVASTITNVLDLESQLKKSKAELKEAELETGSYKRLVAQLEEENSNPKSKGSAAA